MIRVVKKQDKNQNEGVQLKIDRYASLENSSQKKKAKLSDDKEKQSCQCTQTPKENLCAKNDENIQDTNCVELLKVILCQIQAQKESFEEIQLNQSCDFECLVAGFKKFKNKTMPLIIWQPTVHPYSNLSSKNQDAFQKIVQKYNCYENIKIYNQLTLTEQQTEFLINLLLQNQNLAKQNAQLSKQLQTCDTKDPIVIKEESQQQNVQQYLPFTQNSITKSLPNYLPFAQNQIANSLPNYLQQADLLLDLQRKCAAQLSNQEKTKESSIQIDTRNQQQFDSNSTLQLKSQLQIGEAQVSNYQQQNNNLSPARNIQKQLPNTNFEQVKGKNYARNKKRKQNKKDKFNKLKLLLENQNQSQSSEQKMAISQQEEQQSNNS